MQITKQQLSSMVMREGRVLVKMSYVVKDHLDFSGTKVKLVAKASTTQYDLGCRYGEVVKTPDKADIPYLNYSFKSEVEIEPGDIVWWSQLAIGRIIRSKDKELIHFTCEGDDYYEIHYNELILRKRGDSYMGLNDRVIAKPIMPEAHHMFDLSSTSLGSPVKDKFDLVYIPSFKGSYDNGRNINLCEVNQRVLVSQSGNMVGPLEDESNRYFEHELVYFRSADISAIYEEELR
jgi:hypothetical protein